MKRENPILGFKCSGSRNLTVWECYARVILDTSLSVIPHQSKPFHFLLDKASHIFQSSSVSSVNTYRAPAACQILCSGHTSTLTSNFLLSRCEYSVMQAIMEVCLNTEAKKNKNNKYIHTYRNSIQERITVLGKVRKTYKGDDA